MNYKQHFTHAAGSQQEHLINICLFETERQQFEECIGGCLMLVENHSQR